MTRSHPGPLGSRGAPFGGPRATTGSARRSAVALDDDRPGLDRMDEEIQRIEEDSLLQSRIAWLAERMAGRKAFRAEPSRRVRLTALFSIDRDDHGRNPAKLDESLHRHDRAVAKPSTAGQDHRVGTGRLDLLQELRKSFLAKPAEIRREAVREVARCDSADCSGAGELAQPIHGKDAVDVGVRAGVIVMGIVVGEVDARVIRRDDSVRRVPFGVERGIFLPSHTGRRNQANRRFLDLPLERSPGDAATRKRGITQGPNREAKRDASPLGATVTSVFAAPRRSCRSEAAA